MLNEMANFLWSVLREPILASIAMASVISMMIVLSTWFNFKLPTEED